MAIRDTISESKAKVLAHKTETGNAAYGNFYSAEDRDTFLQNYADAAIAQARTDFSTRVSGDPRIKSYTAGSLTTLQKSTTGADQINASLLTAYANANSYVVHESHQANSVGKGCLIFEGGTMYWVPAYADFIKFKNLLERSMAYQYISTVAGAGASTADEISDALTDYEDYRDSIT